MVWTPVATTETVVITAAERREPMRGFLQQLPRAGCEPHVIPAVAYEYTRRLPLPLVVFADINGHGAQAPNLPQQIRAVWEYVPIILLASSTQVPGIAFHQHLHDFLVLPVALAELEARVRFALWKTRGVRRQQEHAGAGSLHIDMEAHEVWVGSRRVDLTFKEFELLRFLMAHPHRVLSRAELLAAVWQSDYYGGTRTVDVHVQRLRQKLGPAAGGLIHTVRNTGYRFS